MSLTETTLPMARAQEQHRYAPDEDVAAVAEAELHSYDIFVRGRFHE